MIGGSDFHLQWTAALCWLFLSGCTSTAAANLYFPNNKWVHVQAVSIPLGLDQLNIVSTQSNDPTIQTSVQTGTSVGQAIINTATIGGAAAAIVGK